MVGTNSVKLMRSRSMVLSTASGSKPFIMCTVPPRIRVGSTDVADRRHREITRAIRYLEIGEDRTGETAELTVVAQRALGFTCGAAGVAQRRDIVGTGEAACGGVACLLDRLQQIDAVIGRSHRKD